MSTATDKKYYIWLKSQSRASLTSINQPKMLRLSGLSGGGLLKKVFIRNLEYVFLNRKLFTRRTWRSDLNMVLCRQTFPCLEKNIGKYMVCL